MINFKHVLIGVAGVASLAAFGPAAADKLSGDIDQTKHCQNPEWGSYTVTVPVGPVKQNGEARPTREVKCFPNQP